MNDPLVARIRAALRLISPDDITPQGIRIIEKVLDAPVADDLVKLRKFIAREVEGAEAWTEVPLLYETGYVSAMLVVDKYIERIEEMP